MKFVRKEGVNERPGSIHVDTEEAFNTIMALAEENALTPEQCAGDPALDYERRHQLACIRKMKSVDNAVYWGDYD